MATPAAEQALSILRTGAGFNWIIVSVFLLVLLAYGNEIEKKNWNVILGALALWGMDLFNEIWNALVFHFSNYAAVWMTPGDTSYLIFIGLNIEITFMFAIMGLFACKVLPQDKHAKIFGKISNRVFYAIMDSILAVIVEYVLHAAGALVWTYPWWNVSAPWLIFLVGYLPFFVVAFIVYDAEKMKTKIAILGTIFAVDFICIAIFIPLGWI
ncbi:MAG TPA: hypothetical protein VKK79_20245 [Candidatus Lokiarchaeia archaeon]|nr:hypothetical protein [Candidatus Lokiarchaeia archaeon]